MCDFSLDAYKSRPAKVGDKLAIHGFSTGTKGFIEVDGDEHCAVCIQPGTELVFDESVQRVAGLFSVVVSVDIGFKVARFGKRNREVRLMHHDCLEFPDETYVMLQSLRLGQTATVLQLPAQPQPDKLAVDQQVFKPELDPASA